MNRKLTGRELRLSEELCRTLPILVKAKVLKEKNEEINRGTST